MKTNTLQIADSPVVLCKLNDQIFVNRGFSDLFIVNNVYLRTVQYTHTYKIIFETNILGKIHCQRLEFIYQHNICAINMLSNVKQTTSFGLIKGALNHGFSKHVRQKCKQIIYLNHSDTGITQKDILLFIMRSDHRSRNLKRKR